ERRRRHAAHREARLDRVGLLLGQRLALRADRDRPVRHLWMLQHHQRRLVDDDLAAVIERTALPPALAQQGQARTLEVRDLQAARVGAAGAVVDAVGRLGLVRALVGGVGDAVVIAVGLRAAVLVLHAVLVLGAQRALVADVGDAVAVVVGIRAAVPVLEAVLILLLVGALIERVHHAVAVGVALVGRAAVLVEG